MVVPAFLKLGVSLSLVGKGISWPLGIGNQHSKWRSPTCGNWPCQNPKLDFESAVSALLATKILCLVGNWQSRPFWNRKLAFSTMVLVLLASPLSESQIGFHNSGFGLVRNEKPLPWWKLTVLVTFGIESWHSQWRSWPCWNWSCQSRKSAFKSLCLVLRLEFSALLVKDGLCLFGIRH